MVVEWRKCNKFSWALCDGDCDRCNTYATSFTTNTQSSSIKYGHWQWVDGVRCSICNYKLQTTGLTSYCPNCGARMDGEVNENETY